MTISHVQSVGATSAAATQAATLPATPTNGNLLVAVGRANISDPTQLTLSEAGWTAVATIGNATPNANSLRVFRKIASGDSATVNLNATGATTIELTVTEYHSTTGWQSTPEDQVLTVSPATNVATLSTGTTGVTAVADEVAVAALGLGGASGGIPSWTNSFANRVTSSSPNGRLWIADRILTATGAYETTATWVTARPTRMALVTFKAVVANAWTATITDAEGLTDSRTQAQIAARSVTDAEALTDSRTVAAVAARTATDPLGLTDTATRVLAAAQTVTDPLAASDAIVQAAASARTVTDPLGITDTASSTVTAQRTVTDSLGATDTVTWVTTLARIITDALGLLDQIVTTLVQDLKLRVRGREDRRAFGRREDPRSLTGRENRRGLSGREDVTP